MPNWSRAECSRSVSLIERLQRLGFNDLWRNRPKIAGWIDRLTTRPAFKKAQPPAEFMLPCAAAAA